MTSNTSAATAIGIHPPSGTCRRGRAQAEGGMGPLTSKHKNGNDDDDDDGDDDDDDDDRPRCYAVASQPTHLQPRSSATWATAMTLSTSRSSDDTSDSNQSTSLSARHTPMQAHAWSRTLSAGLDQKALELEPHTRVRVYDSTLVPPPGWPTAMFPHRAGRRPARRPQRAAGPPT
jgi:hypothetical protein